MKNKLLLFCVVLISAGCYYDNIEEVYGTTTCNTTNVTYSNTIAGILNRNACLSCHTGSAPSGGFRLETYGDVKAKITDGKLWGSINHLPGFTAMPQGLPKMSQCDINKLKAWIDSGTPE